MVIPRPARPCFRIRSIRAKTSRLERLSGGLHKGKDKGLVPSPLGPTVFRTLSEEAVRLPPLSVRQPCENRSK